MMERSKYNKVKSMSEAIHMIMKILSKINISIFMFESKESVIKVQI